MKTKLILSILSACLFSMTALAQQPTVRQLDSTAVRQLEVGEVTYFNGSVQSSIDIEQSTKLFVDFGSKDHPATLDSMVVSLGDKQYSYAQFHPLLISNLNKDVEIGIRLYHAGEPIIFPISGNEELTIKVNRLERPVFAEDTVVFGILALILAFIFYTSHLDKKKWKVFYRIVPALLLCYLVPAILVLCGVISAEYSHLYNMAKDYLLPAALILMTLGIDFKAIKKLGGKALTMFLAGTVGVIIGGPIAIMVYSLIDPSVVGGEGYEAAWRGMATIAGSWIGGGANQNAMFETYKYAPDLYGKMVVVDIVVANMWMAFLLWAASRAEKFDRWLKADTSSVEDLKIRVREYQASVAKQPTLTDYMVILGIAFGIVALSHWWSGPIAEWIDGLDFTIFGWHFIGEGSPLASGFLWLVVLATTGGLLLSLTKLRRYDGAGASKIGSVFIYILVATIGMKMELAEAVKQPQLIVVGIIWMVVHAGFMFLIAKWIKAPLFFLAVGSKANIGGAASAPVVAAAFDPALASVGAILAVLGYAIGTYGAIFCAELMHLVAP